jgi:hypothetical protein
LDTTDASEAPIELLDTTRPGKASADRIRWKVETCELLVHDPSHVIGNGIPLGKEASRSKPKAECALETERDAIASSQGRARGLLCGQLCPLLRRQTAWNREGSQLIVVVQRRRTTDTGRIN